MPSHHFEELLVLTKTYPIPSEKYKETTCVAAINRAGEMRRLYPVPFRFMQGDTQFRRWEWIRARVSSTIDHGDNRPESHKIDVYSISRHEQIGTKDQWRERLQWINPFVVSDPDTLERLRVEQGKTLGCVRPSRLLQLDITPEEREDWTPEERRKLEKMDLFDVASERRHTTLRKVPFRFHYRYECETPSGPRAFRHLITDWEAGALYWNCVNSHGAQWKLPFQQKLEGQFSKLDLIFLMGILNVSIRA